MQVLLRSRQSQDQQHKSQLEAERDHLKKELEYLESSKKKREKAFEGQIDDLRRQIAETQTEGQKLEFLEKENESLRTEVDMWSG